MRCFPWERCNRTSIILVGFLVICTFLTTCSLTTETTPWVIGVYMAADVGDLHGVALRDIQEMEEARMHAMEVVVLVDRFQYSYRNDADASDWDDTRAYRIRGGAREEIAIPELGLRIGGEEERDMGSEATLEGFVSYLAAQYPEYRKMIVLWGHGEGYRSPIFPPDDRNIVRGVAVDNGAAVETRLRIKEIGGVFSRHPVEIVALDACIGANIELAYELRNSNAVLLASQENVRSSGWDYKEMIQAISGSDRGVATISTKIVETYNQQYGDAFPYSAIITRNSTDIVSQWKELMVVLEGIILDADQKARLQELLLNKNHLFPQTDIVRLLDDQSIRENLLVDVHLDLYLFLRALQQSSDIVLSADEKQRIINLQHSLESLMLVRKPNTPTGPQGISIYLGALRSDNQVMYSGVYSSLDPSSPDFVHDTSWNEEGFLQNVFP